jgi:hypothetical protein
LDNLSDYLDNPREGLSASELAELVEYDYDVPHERLAELAATLSMEVLVNVHQLAMERAFRAPADFFEAVISEVVNKTNWLEN